MEWFSAFHPVLQSLLGGLFTWAVTAGGAVAVFLTAKVKRRLLDAMLGCAGGVMIAVNSSAPAVCPAHGGLSCRFSGVRSVPLLPSASAT